MPRGKKSKARARERRDQNRVQQQKLKDAQPSAPEERESPSSAHASGDSLPNSSTAGFLHTSQSPVHSIYAGIGLTLSRSEKVYQIKGNSSTRSNGSDSSGEPPKYDLVKSKTKKLMDYMLSKYKMNQSLKREEMVRVVNKSVKKLFPEILKRACQHLDMGFGLELKEVHPNANTFKLVSKHSFKDEVRHHSQLGLPTRRILYSVLSVIYLNHRCAPEEKIWLLLNQLGIYDGIQHIIVGDARKLLTQHLVQEKYLEYHQVPDSDPPKYVFLWGTQAYTGKCMKKVLEFLLKYREYVTHGDDTLLYEDAWWEQEEKGKDDLSTEDGI
uniref:melanoma-associated antigen B4-like n=1 Tax=Jaculus jaculus TaxID=51337 RepID=UPI001E1B05C4|nr:melanoma-associated antigen B4-like [Jaculus jaculus]